MICVLMRLALWDIDELYDFELDLAERINHVNETEHEERVRLMNKQIPMLQDRGEPSNKRRASGSAPGD